MMSCLFILFYDYDSGNELGAWRRGTGKRGPRKPKIQYCDVTIVPPQERGDAEELAKKVRVLCWVMTGPDNHKTKAAHVKVPDSPAMCFVVLLSFPTNVIAGNLGKALQQTPLHEFERGQGPLHIS